MNLRSRAVALRRKGWSYALIGSKLGLSKSTLSNWLREIPFAPNATVRKRIHAGPFVSAMRKNREKVRNIILTKRLAATELGALSIRDLWLLGLGLYIGEGGKLYESVRLINSDPDVMCLAVTWFHRICRVPMKHFTMSIHLYPDTPRRQAIRFWSKVTGIRPSQFGKTQVDRRTNKSGMKQRKLPYGTAHLRVRSMEKPELGVQLHRRIMGWIEAAYRQSRASYNGHYLRFPT